MSEPGIMGDLKEVGRWSPRREEVRLQETGEATGARSQGPCDLEQKVLTLSQEQCGATEGTYFRKDPLGLCGRWSGRPRVEQGGRHCHDPEDGQWQPGQRRDFRE